MLASSLLPFSFYTAKVLGEHPEIMISQSLSLEQIDWIDSVVDFQDS